MNDIYFEEDKKYDKKAIILILVLDLALFGAIIYLLNNTGCLSLTWAILLAIVIYVILYFLLVWTNSMLAVLMVLPFMNNT